jgi:hypothetical protein
MSSSQRRLPLLVILLCTVGYGASCPPGTPPFTVPTADPHTHPDVVLDVHFAQGQILTVTPAASVPEVPPQLGANDEISLVALCTDNDSGCRNIEIFAEATTTNSNGSVVPAAPGPAVAESLDPNATPGGTASQKRNATVKLGVAQLRGASAGLKLDVSARATNSHNDQWNTKKVSLFWSHQAPLALPDCPRFFGSVRAAVLDSRAVTVDLQNLKAANPAKTSFKIGIQEPPPPNTRYILRLDIEETNLPPTSATFKLVDETGFTRDLLTVDSRNCTAAGTLLQAAMNSSSGDLTVDSSTTTTIVLREPNTGLGAYGMKDAMVWNEATFWPAFGGKKTTITWVHH